MAERDYYVILGIPRTETPSGIRSAFRDLVKVHHPDRAGPQGAEAFREVVEAYRVLSDPESRRRYDDDLQHRQTPRTDPIRVRYGARESLDSEPLVPEPVSVFGQPDEIRPSYEALCDRFRANFDDVLAPKSEHPEPLHFQVTLSPEEARTGGVLPINVPVFCQCPECRGPGHIWGTPCGYCDQQGFVQREATVHLRIPPGVRSGSVIDVALDRYGIHNLWIRAVIQTSV
jgi:molecular chaperone DnaJ